MFYKKSLTASLLIILSLSACNNSQTFRLEDYEFSSASVLPTFTERNQKYVPLYREGFGITKKHTYDDLSGSRDKGETDPTTCAAREFHEEAIAEECLGWSLDDAIRYINPCNKNTWAVLAYSKDADPNEPYSKKIRNVTYLVDFNAHKDDLFNNFYQARAIAEKQYDELGTPGKHRTKTEKDMIAKVKWNDLKKAIVRQKNYSDPVYVRAMVLNPESKKFERQKVKLRPFLVIKLKPFFLGNTYEEGENQKVRFYQD